MSVHFEVPTSSLTGYTIDAAQHCASHDWTWKRKQWVTLKSDRPTKWQGSRAARTLAISSATSAGKTETVWRYSVTRSCINVKLWLFLPFHCFCFTACFVIVLYLKRVVIQQWSFKKTLVGFETLSLYCLPCFHCLFYPKWETGDFEWIFWKEHGPTMLFE